MVGARGGFLFEQGGVFFLLLQCCAFALLVCEAQRFECKNARVTTLFFVAKDQQIKGIYCG